MSLVNWLDKPGMTIRVNGVDLPKQQAINFVGFLDSTDDPANQQTTIAILSAPWISVDHAHSPYFSVRANSPWLALDLTAGAISVSLWSALDGDIVVLSDVEGKADDTHALTLSDGGFDNNIASRALSFSSTQTYSDAGFIVRLKFLESAHVWLPW